MIFTKKNQTIFMLASIVPIAVGAFLALSDGRPKQNKEYKNDEMKFTYKGALLSGKFFGPAHATFDNGDVIKGDFGSDYRIHGGYYLSVRDKGTTEVNEKKFETKFNDGTVVSKKSSKSYSADSEGYKYSGGYKTDKSRFKGTITFIDGSKYDGEMINFIPDGKGTYIFADGTKKTGKFENGKYVDK